MQTLWWKKLIYRVIFSCTKIYCFYISLSRVIPLYWQYCLPFFFWKLNGERFTKIICDIIYVQITMTGLLNLDLKCILYRKSTCISYLVIFCIVVFYRYIKLFLIGLFQGVFMLCEKKKSLCVKTFLRGKLLWSFSLQE